MLEIALKFLTRFETSLPDGVGLALPSIEGRGHSKELLLETNPIYTFNFFATWRSESVPLHYSSITILSPVNILSYIFYIHSDFNFLQHGAWESVPLHSLINWNSLGYCGAFFLHLWLCTSRRWVEKQFMFRNTCQDFFMICRVASLSGWGNDDWWLWRQTSSYTHVDW